MTNLYKGFLIRHETPKRSSKGTKCWTIGPVKIMFTGERVKVSGRTKSTLRNTIDNLLIDPNRGKTFGIAYPRLVRDAQ